MLTLHFQISPRGQSTGSVTSALNRISLAASLIQCFISDSLDTHGLGRKTIQFAQDYNEEMVEDSNTFPSVFLLKSQLSSMEAHTMSQSDLWTYYAKELLTHFCHDQHVKFLAITNVTK